MKRVILGLFLVFGPMIFAAEQPFTLVNDEQGYSYLQINADMKDFEFTSDFKSVGNSGKVGVFKYEAGLEGQALKDYIAEYDANDAKFSKHENNGTISLGDVSTGDRYGFYLLRNNDDLIRIWNFQYKHGQAYIAFDKNGGGKDEWISVKDYSWVVPPPPDPSGAPLPGSLAVLAIGSLFGAVSLKKKAFKKSK